MQRASCLNQVLPLFVGSIFLLIGLGLAIFGANNTAAEGNRIAAMTVVRPDQFERQALGDTILLEGVLNQRNQLQFREFVAYYSDEYSGRDSDGDAQWDRDETVNPELIVGEGRNLAYIGADYRQSGYHAEWQEPGPLQVRNGEGTKRYFGLVNGQTVLALGVIERGVEGAQLRAEFVFAGDQAAFVAERQSTARFLRGFGALFAGVGGFLVIAILRRPLAAILFGR